jgi:hypothetical protein
MTEGVSTSKRQRSGTSAAAGYNRRETMRATPITLSRGDANITDIDTY